MNEMKIICYCYEGNAVLNNPYTGGTITPGEMIAYTYIYPDDDNDIFEVRMEDAIQEGYLPDGIYSFFQYSIPKRELSSLIDGLILI